MSFTISPSSSRTNRKETVSPVWFSLFVIIFSLASLLCSPPTSLCSPQVFWHPGEVTWLCSGTCGACVAAAGTRWAPAGSLWMASVASPPAHAPPLEHTHTHIYRNCNQTHYGNVLMIKPLQQDLLYLAHPPHADTFSSYLSGSSPTSLKYLIRFCSHWQAAEYRRWLIVLSIYSGLWLSFVPFSTRPATLKWFLCVRLMKTIKTCFCF